VLQLHATIALREGHAAEARNAIGRALTARPSHVPSLVLAARADLALGAPARALPHLRLARELDPAWAEPAFLLCRALLALDDPALGPALNDAAARHPTQAGAWLELAVALQRAGRPGPALAAFVRAAAADPALALAWFGQGVLLREAGRLEEARAALNRAVVLDPQAAPAWFALGLACQDEADEAAAATAYRAALAARPEFAEAAVNLGIALQRQGDMAGAMQAFRRAVAVRPDTFGRIAQALTAASTGTLWLDTGDLRRALFG
jgi:tetratricopeptide (TPR) repeat protein